MKQTIYERDFIEAFKSYDREENFSYLGLCALFAFYDEVDPDYELDVIAICCEWVEYSDDELDDLSEAYDGILSDDLTDIDLDQWVEALNDHTLVIKLDYSILFVCF